jgi:hypothetical protein
MASLEEPLAYDNGTDLTGLICAVVEAGSDACRVDHVADADVIRPGAVPVLDDMEAEHQRVDPLLAAVDAGVRLSGGARRGLPHPDLLADAV